MVFFVPSLVSSDSPLIGEIVGPIVGVLCFLALVIVVAIFLRRRKLEKSLEAFALADTESQISDSRVVSFDSRMMTTQISTGVFAGVCDLFLPSFP